MRSSIRLRSTGLVVFGSRLVSVVTGLAFLVMVARWLNPSQFGLWEFIVDLVTFAAYPAGLIGFWVTRDVARGKLVGRTAIVSSLLLSTVGIGIYLLFALTTFPAVATNFIPFLLAILLVPLSYWNQVSNAIVVGYRPAGAGYATLASEVCKLGVAYPLLFVFRTGINGVIIALMASYLSQAVVATWVTRQASSGDLELPLAGRWLRAGWLPAINTIPYTVGIADTFFAALGFGTTVAGYYQAAFAVASIVGYSLYLGTALYPLLLGGGAEDLPAMTLDLSMLFGIPMAVGASVLAPHILYLLAPKYVPAASGLVILSFSLLLYSASVIFDFTLLGRETADVDEDQSFSRYARSNLLIIPLANLIYSVSYLVAMYASLSIATRSGYSTSQTVAAWALSQLAPTVALVVWKGRRASRSARVINPGSLSRYAVIALVMGVALQVASPFLLPNLEILAFAVRLLLTVGVGALIYFGLLYVVDAEFRLMVGSFARALKRGRAPGV